MVVTVAMLGVAFLLMSLSLNLQVWLLVWLLVRLLVNWLVLWPVALLGIVLLCGGA